MFTLSGAINVLLFLIIRPQLLLFPGPRKAAEPEEQRSPLNTGPVILLNTIQHERSSETRGMGPVDDLEERPQNFAFEGSRNHEASGVGPTPRFDDI
jgi:hypothetical protein